jgi:hypothetical protein
LVGSDSTTFQLAPTKNLLFKNGVTKLTDITATTNVGIMFTIVILSMTTRGSSFFNSTLGPLKAQKMRVCIPTVIVLLGLVKEGFFLDAR